MRLLIMHKASKLQNTVKNQRSLTIHPWMSFEEAEDAIKNKYYQAMYYLRSEAWKGKGVVGCTLKWLAGNGMG